jgi:ribonuclease HI
VPQLHVNYIEEDIGVYSIFLKEYNDYIVQLPDPKDGMWHMHFNGACSSEGNRVGIILYSLVGNIHNFSYRLEFACTNNVIEFEALILGIENAFNLGCCRLFIFGDYELIINLVKRIYTPYNKLLKRYTQVVWKLISNLLSFNTTHIRRDMNSMEDRLVVFTTIPTTQLLHQRPDCTFMSLYRPPFMGNVESWQVFLDDESICAFLHNDPLKRKEIISLEVNKFPRGLTPLERSFSSNDMSNKKENIEVESKIKIGKTIFVNIGTQEDPKILKFGAQCLDQEKHKFMDLFCEF